jgi:UDP-glucose 4-epimerase
VASPFTIGVMRAVVTGGAGFIGSHLVDALLGAGDEVTVIDHLRRGHVHNLAPALELGIDLRQGDVSDVDAMVGALTDVRPQSVYHLAAQIDVRRSVRDPSTDAHVNLGGTAAILEAAREAGVARVVLASTAGVYGDPPELPIRETTPVAPLSPYGASKAAAETYMSLFRRLHGLSTLCLRMSNVYGPRQDPHGESGVIAIFCGLAARGEPATIYGDGSQTRDFVFVADVVRAFLAAGRSTAEGALNVSTGRETSLRELAAQLKLRTTGAPGRAGEIQRSVLDPAATQAALGWRAQVGLTEGLELTLAAASAVSSRPRP